MALTLSSLAELDRLPFDEIIDVRAPGEFAEDRIPGAVNLPVLDDAERARVGTIYVQESRFEARKIGAALVAANAARHLAGPLADRPGEWRPLVYCWRGGQRSGAFASILGQIGWRVGTLDGGYRSFRSLVVDALHDRALAHRLILLDGDTGTAKTEILGLLAARGLQVIDLEGLAAHRGSLFGATGQPQPRQKAFESTLALALARLCPERPVIVEAESSKIGDLQIPPSLWAAMRAAPRLRLEAPIDARARYLVRTYSDVVADPAKLLATLDKLRSLQGHAQVEAWAALARGGAFETLARELMERHYDARYAKARRKAGAVDSTIALADLSPSALGAALPRIEAALDALARPATAQSLSPTGA